MWTIGTESVVAECALEALHHAITYISAPTVKEAGEDCCTISWQSAKTMLTGSIEYRLQLSEQEHSNSPLDYKQVVSSIHSDFLHSIQYCLTL